MNRLTDNDHPTPSQSCVCGYCSHRETSLQSTALSSGAVWSYPANYNLIKRWYLLPLETSMPMSCESQVFVYSAKIFVWGLTCCVIDIGRGSVETFLERYKFLPLRLWQRFVMPLCRICFQLISCQAIWSNYTLTECFKSFPNLRPSHRLSSQTVGWTIQLKVHVSHKQIISQTQA